MKFTRCVTIIAFFQQII